MEELSTFINGFIVGSRGLDCLALAAHMSFIGGWACVGEIFFGGLTCEAGL